ncbi:hypothetical protein Slin15195_G125640 [Septoria linicola]|uniref:Uncharacterized protein n=1 Tax=Septoria linicola TaxID=215465 RepID=A0A9Q9B6P6_9PEZI|nr:hypothetical protein Slin14017_G081820 [Septoria linicola]USW59245.1 hypothetical protein Slin15195_G125640 [Septoria linicola]
MAPREEQLALAGLLGAEPMMRVLRETSEVARSNSSCNVQRPMQSNTTWTVAFSDLHHVANGSGPVSASAEYCLAQPGGDEVCSIRINTMLLWIVISCNAVKILCLCTTVCSRGFSPLVTIGDALESFMMMPEQDTVRLGPLSAADVRKNRLALPKHVERRRTLRPGRSRANVASRRRWICCLIICITLLAVDFDQAYRSLALARYGVYTEDDEDGSTYDKVGFSSGIVGSLVALLPYYQYEPEGSQIHDKKYAEAMERYRLTGMARAPRKAYREHWQEHSQSSPHGLPHSPPHVTQRRTGVSEYSGPRYDSVMSEDIELRPLVLAPDIALQQRVYAQHNDSGGGQYGRSFANPFL